jgi:hypothetical protein
MVSYNLNDGLAYSKAGISAIDLTPVAMWTNWVSGKNGSFGRGLD